jgi:hypothetical protein
MILLLAMGAMMATPAPVEIGPREKVIAVAESLVGVTELTGKNDGPLVEAILASTGNKKGDPYCAAFNYYCYREAGLAELVPKTAWSPSWVAQPTWTRAEGGQVPKPADAFGIYFKSKGRVAHTGLVKTWGESTVTTVEGNTNVDAASGSASDRDGGGIWSKRRLARQIYSVKNFFEKKD